MWLTHVTHAIWGAIAPGAADGLERRIALVEWGQVVRGVLLLKVERRVVVVLLARHGVAGHGGRRFSFGELGGNGTAICAVGIVGLAVHVLVFGDPPLPRLAADERPPHCTGHDAASNDDDSGAEYDPSSPPHVRHE